MEQIRIHLLEEFLEIKFPQVYRKFLTESGSAVIDGFRVMGLPTKEVPMSVLEGTLILREKRDDLPCNLVAICVDGTRALCLDLQKGSNEDAPLVEVDLTKKDFVEPRYLGKTFGEWITHHEEMGKRFSIAWNRIKARRKETEEKKGWPWETIIDRVKDYVIGVAAFRYNPVLGCLEVDEFHPINQPHVKKEQPIKILVSEIFSRARDYGGSLKVIFTRDIREDEMGNIPEELRMKEERRKPRSIPQELTA